jgi:cell division protein FtsX
MYARKDEIGIMKLVGASNLMIRAPFVIEGVAQGSVAALIAALGLYLIYIVGLQGATWTGVFAGFAPVFLPSSAVAGLIAGGILLGALGSLSRVSDLMRV